MTEAEKQRQYQSMERLHNAVWQWEIYKAPRPQWDHDHCAVCWAKFCERSDVERQQAGYVHYTANNCEWVCSECYADLASTFGWQAENAYKVGAASTP